MLGKIDLMDKLGDLQLDFEKLLNNFFNYNQIKYKTLIKVNEI